MKTNPALFILAAIALAGCSKGFKSGDGGLLYEIHKGKGGQKISEGDFVSINIIAKTEGDSVLFNTYENGHPSFTVLPRSKHKGDLNAGVQLLAEGDSATIKTNIDSVYDRYQPRPNFKGKYIIYEVKVEKVIAKGVLSGTEFNSRVVKFTEEQARLAKAAEPGKIKNYLTAKKLDMKKTSSGLLYTISKQGTGSTALTGDTVEVNYVARRLDNKIVGTNIKDTAVNNKTFNQTLTYKPIIFTIGAYGIIPGWNEGFRLLNKGAKAVFVLPSKLAYIGRDPLTAQGAQPFAFEVELLDIRKAKPAVK